MNYFDEDGDEILFHEFASKEEAMRGASECPSCGVAYHDHLGLTETCSKLQAIFDLVESHLDHIHAHPLPFQSHTLDVILIFLEEIMEFKANRGGKIDE